MSNFSLAFLNSSLVIAPASRSSFKSLIFKKFNIFDLFDIKDQLVNNLSHGQKKKVTLTKLLFSNTKLWIMDEPLNGLDQKSVKVFKVICEKHTKAGGAILFSSHIDPKLKITKKIIQIVSIPS